MKSRLTLFALVLLFFTPILVAVLLNSRWLDWDPAPGRSHGDLVEPVIDLGDHLPGTGWTGKWYLVRRIDAACDSDCIESLYWLRQARAAQDRHVPDVGLLVVAPNALDAPVRDAIRRLSPVWRIVDGPAGEALIRVLPGGSGNPETYIMDPETNIMMRYPAGTDPNGIRKDLDRLLTWTQEQ